MPNSLWPHELQQARLLCQSLSPWVSQTHVHWVSNAIQPFQFMPPPTFLLSIFPSIRAFSNESSLASWYWSFSFSISPFNEYSGLISIRNDWFDLLAVQGIHKSLLQHCNLIASILWCSAFFTVQLSHPYLTTGKTIALIIGNFVYKKWYLCFWKHCLGLI